MVDPKRANNRSIEAMADHMNTWAELNHLQTGRYGEYFAKMALVRAGFDVFNAEVDDKGIDFVLRADGDVPHYYDVQVKTVRSRNTYVFMRKDKFRLTPNMLLARVILDAGGEPEMYLIPANAWREAKPPFANRDYDGKKSAPEYGLTLSPSAMVALEPFRFAGSIPALTHPKRARNPLSAGRGSTGQHGHGPGGPAEGRAYLPVAEQPHAKHRLPCRCPNG